MITSMSGLCERTHLNYTDTQSFVNLLPEPWTVQDTIRGQSTFSGNVNEIVYAFEGVTPTAAALDSTDTKTIVTISPAAADYVGVTTPFETPSVAFAQELKSISNFKFNASDNTEHSGGIFRGTPVMFNSPSQAKLFIRRLLGGCGFRTIMPPTGYDSDGTPRWQYVTPENAGGGNAYAGGVLNESDFELESIRFITSDDIYNMYILPTNFCTGGSIVRTSLANSVTGAHTLSDITGMGEETNDKSKLLGYPYTYYKAITANGDNINIYPQVYNVRNGVWGNSSNLLLDLKFIGGDMPRLMGRFIPALSTENPFANSSLGEWFTIRNYPCLSLSITDSYSPQRQREINVNRQLSAVAIEANNKEMIDHPFRAAHRDGEGNSQQETLNLGQKLLSNLGSAVSNIVQNPQFYSDPVQQTVNNAVVNANSGASIQAAQSYVQGNDYLSQYGIPAFSIYQGGCSNAEIYSLARYIDNFGCACNCTINPLNNSGSIFGGLASVGSNNGRTFYRFANIEITGVMPPNWKADIKALFESGVYLV